MLWRHGDVLIATIDAIPEGGVRLHDPVLAHGEVTGHTHRVADPHAAELWLVQGVLYLKILEATRIIHEEHAAIPLEPGTYRVWQQREYVPERRRGTRGVSFRTVSD
ncbi:MAG: hypothetical protein H0X24_13760 [Ktedonobacterales bacterium]|nr:hypothetical protein [Ktedonobacterales bacterium]